MFDYVRCKMSWVSATFPYVRLLCQMRDACGSVCLIIDGGFFPYLCSGVEPVSTILS